jgi:hypothetical protein
VPAPFNATLRPSQFAGVTGHDMPTQKCGCCGDPIVPGAAAAPPVRHRDIGLLCPLCARAAQRLVDAYLAAQERQRAEFHGQLPQLIKDVRSGAEIPTFYRGEIA